MNKQEMDNVLDFYYETTELKEKLRQGWVYWNVTDTRIESIAEHIYGAQMLAVAIYSECKLDVDIFKVMSMLALHETEEVRIGDLTPIDNVSDEDKLALGDKAVKDIFKNLNMSKPFVDLITEFNERKTKEAKLAFLCDKLDCILQIKKYSAQEKCSIANASAKVLSDYRVKAIIEDGAKSVYDIFAANDRKMYEGTIIEELFDYVKEYELKK